MNPSGLELSVVCRDYLVLAGLTHTIGQSSASLLVSEIRVLERVTVTELHGLATHSNGVLKRFRFLDTLLRQLESPSGSSGPFHSWRKSPISQSEQCRS